MAKCGQTLTTFVANVEGRVAVCNVTLWRAQGCKIGISRRQDRSDHQCSGTQNWPGEVHKAPRHRLSTFAAIYEMCEAAARPMPYMTCDEWAKTAGTYGKVDQEAGVQLRPSPPHSHQGEENWIYNSCTQCRWRSGGVDGHSLAESNRQASLSSICWWYQFSTGISKYGGFQEERDDLRL